jgi:hypothetical protein
MTEKRRLAAILVADVVGYSKLRPGSSSTSTTWRCNRAMPHSNTVLQADRPRAHDDHVGLMVVPVRHDP